MEYELNKKLQSAFCGIFKHLNLKKIETKLIWGWNGDNWESKLKRARTDALVLQKRRRKMWINLLKNKYRTRELLKKYIQRQINI